MNRCKATCRVSGIVNLMKSYGEKITDETVVAKVLRSLINKFEHVVAAIEESKDLSDYTFDELMGSLLAHEDRLNKSHEKVEEKAFQVKEESSFSKEKSTNFSGRGRGRGRGKGQFSESHQNKSDLQCWCCKKSGHTKAYCWTKKRDEQKHTNFLRKLRMKVSCSWLILQLLIILMVFGLLIVDAQIICWVQSLYLEILMSQKRVWFDSMMTSKYELKAKAPYPSKQHKVILNLSVMCNSFLVWLTTC